VEAGPDETPVTLSADTLATVITEDRPRRSRRQNRERSERNDRRSLSPDGQWEATCRDDDLYLSNIAADVAPSLLADGTDSHSFHRNTTRARAIDMQYDLPEAAADDVDVQWSPDSQWLLAFQTTRVSERQVSYVQSTPLDQLQPVLQSYPYLKAGDPVPVPTPRLFRLSDRQEIVIPTELFPKPWSLEFLRWGEDGQRFYLLYNERGHQRLRVLEVTLADGRVRAVVDESSGTFIHYSSDGKFELRWLPGGQLLWASERSGWNHLYRYDLASGSVLNAVTSGDWNVRRIEHLEETTGTVWFFAVGVRPEQDPYHEHFCRVQLDGTGFKILTEGDGTHDVKWSPDRRWFLDRWSRVDLPPITELRSADGQKICNVESADASSVIDTHGSLPMRFTAKGRDGVTDIWGVVHKPRDFDPNRRYPVVENIYAGPHDHHVPKSFRQSWRHQHQIANAGFLVVQIDGMGTAWRSKAFHDVCWRNLRDAGFPDRIAWMRALAESMPQADISRVGIYGGSAGGQNAMAALIWHHDFYKVAVADCGCHDNRMDKIWWNEQWLGELGDESHYIANSNTVHAGEMQGQLMLAVGELDRNVDPATSFQVARILIKHDKPFDFVVVPGAGHGACETPWAARKRVEFFREHLSRDGE
jgi:dipeptidyl aminopeptidase/acylaminoacyl peptidase